MRPDCRTARTYLQIDELIKKIELRELETRQKACGYSTEALVTRLAQILALRITEPLLKLSISDPIKPLDSVLVFEELEAGGVRIKTATGKTRISLLTAFKDFFKFLALRGMVLEIWAKQLFCNVRLGPAVRLHSYIDLNFVVLP